MKKYLRSRLDSFFAPFARKADIDNLYVQLSALFEVKEIIGPGVRLGPLRGWAWSPDALLLVLQELSTRVTRQVVEFGAGESTIVIAAALKAGGGGFLTAIEHDKSFAEGVTRRLRQNELLDFVDVRVVPVCNYASRLGLPAFKSYDLTELDFEFDIALIDGPVVAEFGTATRSVPLAWCLDRLSGDRIVYVDDAARSEEQAVINALRNSNPDLSVEFLGTEKGLFKLRNL